MRDAALSVGILMPVRIPSPVSPMASPDNRPFVVPSFGFEPQFSPCYNPVVLECVTLSNFKAVSGRVELALAPLTLLVGKNGSGKSSILEAIALLTQSSRPHDRRGLVTSGRLVNLGDDVAALYHAGNTDNRLELGLRVRVRASEPPIGASISVRRAERRWEGEWQQSLSESDARVDFLEEHSAESGVRRFARIKGEPPTDYQIAGDLTTFLDHGIFQPAQASGNGVEALSRWRLAAERLAQYLARPTIRYVGALRGAPLMQRELKGTPLTAGSFGSDTLRLASRVQASGDRQKNDRLQRLARRFGLAELAVGWTGGLNELVASFQDLVSETRRPLDHAGFGSQQALPAIVDLVDADSGTSVLIEEIEHSCHPDWIREWGLALAEAVSEWGIQVIATTHAPQMALAVALAVKRGIVPPDRVAIYELSRTKNGVTVDARELSEGGELRQGWLRTFADAEEQLLRDLLADEER